MISSVACFACMTFMPVRERHSSIALLCACAMSSGPWSLRIFLQENQTEHSELRDFMGGVESLSRVNEKMRFPALSKQTRVTDYFSNGPASGGIA